MRRKSFRGMKKVMSFADAKRVARDVLYDENCFRVSDVFEQEIAEAESFWMEEFGR